MRTFALVLATSLLSACGFRPLHVAANPDGLASAPLRGVEVVQTYSDDADNKQAAFLIAQSLRSRIGTGGDAARYRLKITPSVNRSGLAVGRDDVASRYDYNIYTAYELTDAVTGEQLVRDRVYSVATFGAPRDPYGRVASELDAAEQSADSAADRIVTDLAVWFANAPSAPDAAPIPAPLPEAVPVTGPVTDSVTN